MKRIYAKDRKNDIAAQNAQYSNNNNKSHLKLEEKKNNDDRDDEAETFQFSFLCKSCFDIQNTHQTIRCNAIALNIFFLLCFPQNFLYFRPNILPFICFFYK